MSYFVINPFTAVDVQGTVLSITSQATGTFAGAGVYGNAMTSPGTGLGRFVGAGVSEGPFSSAGTAAMNWYGVNALVGAGDLSSDGSGAMTFEGTWTNIQDASLDAQGAGAATFSPHPIAAAAYDIDSAGAATLVGEALDRLLLNHFDGTDGATTVGDEVGGITWTFDSGVELDTAIKKWGTASVLVPTTGGAFDVGVSGAVATGLPDISATSMTLEGWTYMRNGASGGGISHPRLVTTGIPVVIGMGIDPDTDSINIIARGPTSSPGDIFINTTPSVTIDLETWYHWAMVRDTVADLFSFYFNGNRVYSLSDASNLYFDTTYYWQLCGDFRASYGVVHFDDVRVTIGGVLYSGATLVIPTEEFS